MENNIMNVTVDLASYESVRPHLRLRLLPQAWLDRLNERKMAAGWGEIKKFTCDFPDLVIVPYVEDIAEGIGDDRKVCTCVTPKMVDIWGIDIEKVWNDAYENTQNNVIIKTFGELLGVSVFDSITSYVVTNTDYRNGASAILTVKEKMRELFPDGYIVFPSSIHEVIVAPLGSGDAKMVREINQTIVLEEDRLSDEAYEFD